MLAWCVVLPSNTGGALSVLAPSPTSLLKRQCGALGSHAALCCAAIVLLSDAARLDSGSSAALVELAQLLVVGSLLRSLCERHGLQQRPCWCPNSPLSAICRPCRSPRAVLLPTGAAESAPICQVCTACSHGSANVKGTSCGRLRYNLSAGAACNGVAGAAAALACIALVPRLSDTPARSTSTLQPRLLCGSL